MVSGVVSSSGSVSLPVSADGHPTSNATFRGQAVEQSAEFRSALEFFATAQSCREGCQAYKNEVYLLPTELD